MASAQVVETSVNTNNSPSQDYTTNPDDHSNHNIIRIIFDFIFPTNRYYLTNTSFSFLFFRGESPKEVPGNYLFFFPYCLFLFTLPILSMWSEIQTLQHAFTISTEGSLYNNRIKAPQARHIPNKEEADFYMAPVDNHKRWEQLQQQTKTGPARSTYNSEEISMYKQNHLSKLWIYCGC